MEASDIMKEQKRLFVFLLIVSLTIVNTGLVRGEESNEPSWWAVLEIREAETIGYDIEEIKYKDNLSREQFCSWIIETVELIRETHLEVTIEPPFKDTTNEKVTLAFELGIVEGIGNNLFAPETNITRQEVIVMLIRMIDYLDNEYEYTFGVESKDVVEEDYVLYADNNLIATWAKEEIYRASFLSIVDGVGHNCVDPLGFATNEQGILLVKRVYNKYKEVQTFEAINQNYSLTIKELETIHLSAAELVKSEQVDLAYFDIDVLTSDLCNMEFITKEGKITELVMTSYGVSEDKNEELTVFISNDDLQIEQKILLQVKDVTNFSPVEREKLTFEINSKETLVLYALDLAIDPDGDYISIVGYKRVKGGFGTGVLENQKNFSRFTFTPTSVNAVDIQKYIMTVSDGHDLIEIPIEIEITNLDEY